MAFNPSKTGDPLSVPANNRANSVNDPGFENKQGYYPYDLSHTEVVTPLFGHVTPTMHLITNAGDHHVVANDVKTILNRINGNFLNTLNQYLDSVFVSNRTLFPNNWDKLIPTPVKGDDLPHSARPAVPLYAYFRSFVNSSDSVLVTAPFIPYSSNISIREAFGNLNVIMDSILNGTQLSFFHASSLSYCLANSSFLAYLVSRGQLLDHLGFQFDFETTKDYESSFQYRIDRLFMNYWRFVDAFSIPLLDIELDPTLDSIVIPNAISDVNIPTLLSLFRERYMSAFERGNMLWPYLVDFQIDGSDDFEVAVIRDLFNSLSDFVEAALRIFPDDAPAISTVDQSDDFNGNGSFVNISKALAYQLTIAQHYTNDSVDNIFTSDLYMQLLRACMYPSVNNVSSEPTFDYNGVPTEYDYISYGGFYNSLLGGSVVEGRMSRSHIVGSLLFVLRRSLRYGDKFTTGRTRMLAVGQLSVPVDDLNGMTVNPVDITIGLVAQRALNAFNRVGNKPINYYASVMGVAPSDMPSIPRYVGHRKITLENRVTTNTADDQGKQTTNLVGYSDNMGFDVFIDDYGILLTLNSYDVLPIYTSGIDCDNMLSDRFEYFNPMMQNIGDQPIRMTELIGNPSGYDDTFAYTVRNHEYKYKLSKAHGAICYNMPGFLLKFPMQLFDIESGVFGGTTHIDPDFIRDKPSMLDSVISHTTGASPGDYFHFIVSVHNMVKSARLIQRAPGILF